MNSAYFVSCVDQEKQVSFVGEWGWACGVAVGWAAWSHVVVLCVCVVDGGCKWALRLRVRWG